MSISPSNNCAPFICPGRLPAIPEVDEGNIISASKAHHNDIKEASETCQEKDGKPSVKHPGGGLNYVW